MQNEGKNRSPILCLVRDLLFYSKIRAAAELAGVQMKSLRDPSKLANEIGCGLIVDLNQENALQAAAQWRRQCRQSVVGFVSHVDKETVDTARDLGIARILARSQFEQNLPGILAGFISGKSPD